MDNRVKIGSPERVLRILQRICDAHLPLVIRGDDLTVSIKGKAAGIFVDKNTPLFRVDQVSDKGMQYVLNAQKIQIEFVLSDSMLVFSSSILVRDKNALILRAPSTLVSIERRKNARYQALPSLSSFITLSTWQPAADDLLSPPFYPHHGPISTYLTVADVSHEGLCFLTRFPSLGQIAKKGYRDPHCRLFFPMISPVEGHIEIRWIKRVKEHVKDAEGREVIDRVYRFGALFIEQTEQLRLTLKQYIQQVSTEGAV